MTDRHRNPERKLRTGFGLVTERRHYTTHVIYRAPSLVRTSYFYCRVECGIARFLCAMRVSHIRASSSSPRLPLCQFFSVATSVAELAHGENRVLSQSLSHPAYLMPHKPKQTEALASELLIMAVLYVSRGKAIMFYHCTLFFFFFSNANLRGY